MRGILLIWLVAMGCENTDTGDSSDTGKPSTENQAPVVSLDTPSAGTVVEPGEALAVAGFVADDQDALDSLVVAVSSDLDGELGTVVPSADGQFAIDVVFTTPGDQTLTVSTADSYGLTGSATRTLRVVSANLAPNAPVVEISPSSPITGDGLSWELIVEGNDPDGDELTYTGTWAVDGVERALSDTIDGSEVLRGQTWELSVHAFDGEAESPAATDSVVIGNAAPTLTGLTIGPDDAATGTTLTCTPDDLVDLEGDTLTETYTWWVNGIEAGVTDGALPGSYFYGGDSVQCGVVIEDGYDSVSAASGTLVISGSKPTVPTVSVSPTEPADGDALTCTVDVASYDPDGTEVTYVWSWLVDGEASGYTGESVPAEATSRDEVWTCQVFGQDADGDLSDPGEASVTIGIAWDAEYDAGGADVIISGLSTDGTFGKTVAVIDDLDGDGFGELLVGANGEAGTNGVMYLFAGADLSGELDTTAAIASWTGETTGASLGAFRSVASPGDLDGDGIVDFLFAGANDDTNGDNAGRAYLFYGGGTWGLDEDPGNADWLVDGAVGDQLGARLAAGDLDGDGEAEVVIAAPNASDYARESGTVAIFDAGGVRFSGAHDFADAEWEAQGESLQDGLGWSTKVVGDVSGDGYDDLVVSAIYADDGGDESGVASLILGGTARAGGQGVSKWATAQFVGDAASDRFGYDILGDVDLDDDGINDLLIAEYQDDTGATNAGAVHAFLGRATWASVYQPFDADASILGTDAEGRFGHVMSSPGDVDSDGTNDVLLGALYASPTGLTWQGAAWLLLGPDWDKAASTTELRTRFAGEASNDLFGDAVSVGRADLNGDSRPDFAIGAQGHDNVGSNEGRVYLWFGK